MCSDSRAQEKNSWRKQLRGELEKGRERIRSRPPGPPPPHRFPGVQFNSIPIIWYHRYERFFSRAAGIFGVCRRSKPRAAKRLTIKTWQKPETTLEKSLAPRVIIWPPRYTIWTPKPSPFVRESRFQNSGIFVCRIRNPTIDWNPESNIPLIKTGIHFLKSGIQASKPESKAIFDFVTWSDVLWRTTFYQVT